MKAFLSKPASWLAALAVCLVLGWIAPSVTQGITPTRPKITPTPSSTSATGQFVVHGSDLGTRGAFCLLCDDTAGALGRLLRDDARYQIPVVVVLKAPPDVDRTGPAISTNISQLAHGGFHLQINVQLRADFQSEEFARELVRVLLAERILRNHAELKTNRERVLPDWVLTGVTQALEFRARSRPSAMFAAVFRGGQVFSVDKLLTADPVQLDALSRTIYETSACAIVLALLEQQDGPVRFGKFLNALALDNKSDRDLLKQHFPTLGVSKNSLEKWWSLQMATLATPSALESMTIAQTEQKLDEALTLRYEPLPEKEKKGKKKDTSMEGGLFPFDRFAAIERPQLFFNLTDVVNTLLGVHEVAAVPAKDQDADTSTDKKKKKDNTKDKDEGKGTKKEPEKTGKGDQKSDKTDKKAANKKETPAKPSNKKEIEKKEPEKKTAVKNQPESKEAEKKAPEKKSAPDKKDADKKTAERKESERKPVADKKEPEKKVVGGEPTEKKEAEQKEPGKKAPGKKEPEKKIAEKKTPEKKEKEEKVPELRANPHRVAQRPGSVPEPVPEEKSKDKEEPRGKPAEVAKGKSDKPGAEDEAPKKGSKWNPANWFRKQEKPVPETAKKDEKEDKSSGRSRSGPRNEFKSETPPPDSNAHGTLENYAAIAKRPDRTKILRRNLDLLNALKNQAHPLYRPLIGDYAELVRDLIQDKDRGMSGKLAALHERYLKISNQSKAVESYLDWYQASETQNYSGVFDDYLKLHDKLKKEIHSRGDAISQYLDSLEKEYEN